MNNKRIPGGFPLCSQEMFEEAARPVQSHATIVACTSLSPSQENIIRHTRDRHAGLTYLHRKLGSRASRLRSRRLASEVCRHVRKPAVVVCLPDALAVDDQPLLIGRYLAGMASVFTSLLNFDFYHHLSCMAPSFSSSLPEAYHKHWREATLAKKEAKVR